MKRIFILLWIAVVILTITIVGSIATKSNTKYHNDFIRIFPPHFATMVSTLKTERSYSLVSSTGQRTYLRDRSSDGDVFVLDDDLTDISRIPIKIPHGFDLTIDSPWYFLYNGYSRQIQRGRLADWSVEGRLNDLPGFTLLQPISGKTSILRTVDLQKMKNIFVRSDSYNSTRDILSKQVDGILCTDGFLQYSKECNRLIYLFRYRNQFLSVDTMLNVQFVGKTIDTTTVAKISVVKVNGEIKMSKPPLVVNKGIFVVGKSLLVYSDLVAKNESIEKSRGNSVIDIYSVSDGHYVCSFYIENIAGTRMHSFKVHNRTLIALFSGHIVRYDLNPAFLVH